eukprot:2435809-Pleurochrysis_carterae.AAC.3
MNLEAGVAGRRRGESVKLKVESIRGTDRGRCVRRRGANLALWAGIFRTSSTSRTCASACASFR